MSSGTGANDSISTGELGRRLDTLIDEQREFRGEVNTRFTAFDSTFVRKDVYDAMLFRLAKVENNLGWVGRTIGGTLIVAIGGGLITLAKYGGLG